MNEYMTKRIFKLEKFFNVKKPNNLSWIAWSEELYEKQLQWEEDNDKEFPI